MLKSQMLVGDLLAHGDNGGLSILVGSPQTLLHGVVVESSVERLHCEAPGSLAVLTFEPPADSWRQDALLRRVRDRGFGALAMPHAASFGEGSRIHATRLGLDVLNVNRPMELAHASWQLMEGRESLALAYARKAAHSFEYRADNLSDLISHVASNLGQGVALISKGHVLVESGGTLPTEVLTGINFSPWLDTFSNEMGSVASVRVDSPGRPGLRLAIFGARCSEVQLGAMAMATEVVMPAIAARILIDEVTDVNDAAVATGLLGDFLDRRSTPDNEIEQRMIDRGWQINGYHIGFRITGRSSVDTFQLLRQIKKELADGVTSSFVASIGNGVSGWLSFSEPPTQQEIAYCVKLLRSMHVGLRRLFDVATGVGNLDSGPIGLADTITGASEAARIATARSAAGWFVHMDTLGIEQVLLSWTESDTFVPAARSLLAPLVEAGGELVGTLASFLDHESSVKDTAAALALHRNTVAARIARIQMLLGLDIEDAETRLALHLACRALTR